MWICCVGEGRGSLCVLYDRFEGEDSLLIEKGRKVGGELGELSEVALL